jgi:DNA polymerase
MMRLMQFPQALETVLQTLESMRDETAHRPCASRTVLEALKQIAPARTSENSPRPKIDPPSRDYGAASSAAPSKAGKIDKLAEVQERVRPCTKCPNLASSRTQTVFGIGNPDAEIMFVGEAPGADEDAQGEPFVGRAGQLLTKIIKAMGFPREEVYIANVLKCRPDVAAGSFGNRPPTPREMQTCRPYLMEQIDIIKPKVIVALGAVAVEGLLGTRAPMRELRGRWDSFNGTPLMITYHPAYLLRNQSPSEKRKVWEDMMLVLERLEKPISEKQRNYFL